MRAVVPLAVLALVACQGTATSVNRNSPTPSLSSQASASRSADTPPAANPARSTSSPAAIPNPGITVTSAGKSLACRLPVTWDVQLDAYTYVHRAGFLSFPTGSLSEVRTAPNTTAFYDRAFSKWLPVWRGEVSPDGRRYAYTDGNPMLGDTRGKVHVVDVASGVDRVLYTGAPVFWVVDFAAEGIYLSESHGDVPTTGLWLENPAGGTPRLISSSIYSPVIAGPDAYGLTFNSADPHPAPGGKVGPFNQLTRLDLVTGASTSLFYRPGATLQPLGADQGGDLIVEVLTDWAAPTEWWLITPAATTRKLATFPATSSPGGLDAVDSHGVWYAGGGPPPDGPYFVWLYTRGSFSIVASAKAFSFGVAGGCIP